MPPSIQAQDSEFQATNRKVNLASLLQELKQSLKQEDESTPIPISAAASDSASESQDSGSFANRNPAIIRCIRAHNKAYEAATERKASTYESREKGKLAFREALPPLIGRNNIRNFIACVTYGVAIELISNHDSAQLLHAARAAASVLYQRTRQKAVKYAQENAEKPLKSGVSRPENSTETNETKKDTEENPAD
jgi:hypothetical protein